MALTFVQSKRVAAKMPLTESGGAGGEYSIVAEYLTAAGLASGDIIEMAGVPAYHLVTAVTLLSDQVDSNGSPTITADVGFITGVPGDLAGGLAATRTIGAEFLSASTTPLRAGGTVSSTLVGMARQVASTADRAIGVKIAAAIATLVVGARIRMRVSFIADPGFLS